MNIPITINGQRTILQASPDESLLSVLRSSGFLSVKPGCLKGTCGSCTVLLNNKPIPSCKIPVSLVMNQQIETLEFFSKTEEYACISKGFQKAGIKLCGYCNAGKYLAAYSILLNKEKPTRAKIQEQVGHLSPCCTDTDTLTNGIILAADIYNNLQ